jgi:hypothetical protein
MLNAAWLISQVPSRRVGAWDRASMELELARPCVQSTLPWTAATVHETTFVCILTAAVVPHDSSMDDYGGRRTAWGGAALGGVADQGEVAALAPRGTACSETPSSEEGLPEDPVTGFVSKRAIRTQLKCLPARGCGTR